MKLGSKSTEGVRTVGLKAPGIITFMTSVILTVIVILSKFFGATIPFITGHEELGLLLAQVILALGCILPGL